MSNERAVLVALFVVTLMVGCAGLTGCAGLATYGCPPGMDRRGEVCEGFGSGFVWRQVAAHRPAPAAATGAHAQRGPQSSRTGGE